MKLGQSVLDLIDGSLWESKSWFMEYIPLGFYTVPYQDGVFPHYLEVGPFMSNFVFPPVRVPCLWADEDLRFSGEVVDIVKD